MSEIPHQDRLEALNHPGNAQQKLEVIYAHIRNRYPGIERMAVAVYDALNDKLKTFLSCGAKHPALEHYQAPLQGSLSLDHLRSTRATRIIPDLQAAFGGTHNLPPHTQALLDLGFQSSYTFPMVYNERFLGFVFFNSRETSCFLESVLTELDMMAHMVTLVVFNERSNINTLVATVKSAIQLTHSRDPETGSHLERMARYARIIATELAQTQAISDDFIEHIYLFAPLHDLGKIKVPDKILLKPGQLDADEKDEMQRHPAYGQQLIDVLIENHGLSGVSHIDMLRNIALYHHEQVDGNGYPAGLKGDAIPLESRIVTVADVFDALTSTRPYKHAWSNEEAFREMRCQAGIKWDSQCVKAMIRCESQLIEVQNRFRENEYG
ncbi:MAG: HD-GYP domain-containing protein [Hahellaceae bacterium]|nr:HD-GYP domain-containing protein [Hahellaceae bacterium]